MRFDPALAARDAFRLAETELGPDWEAAVEWEETFSSSIGQAASEAYQHLLALAVRHPRAHAFQAFCIYSTWQQAAEETIPRHFQTGVRLCEAYLAAREGKPPRELAQVAELCESFRAGLGLSDEHDLHSEFGRDALKGGD